MTEQKLRTTSAGGTAVVAELSTPKPLAELDVIIRELDQGLRSTSISWSPSSGGRSEIVEELDRRIHAARDQGRRRIDPETRTARRTPGSSRPDHRDRAETPRRGMSGRRRSGPVVVGSLAGTGTVWNGPLLTTCGRQGPSRHHRRCRRGARRPREQHLEDCSDRDPARPVRRSCWCSTPPGIVDGSLVEAGLRSPSPSELQLVRGGATAASRRDPSLIGGGEMVEVSVDGADRPGIVAGISGALRVSLSERRRALASRHRRARDGERRLRAVG